MHPAFSQKKQKKTKKQKKKKTGSPSFLRLLDLRWTDT